MDKESTKRALQAIEQFKLKEFGRSKILHECLEDIKDNLIAKKYSSTMDFIDSSKKSIVDSYYPNEESGPFLIIRQYLADTYIKELINFQIYNTENWAKLVMKLREKHGKLLGNAPRGNIPTEFKAKFEENEKKRSNSSETLSAKDLNDFVSSVKNLNDEESHQQMINIIKNNEPHHDTDKTDITIDLTTLKMSTCIALIDYVKKSFKAKNIDYPCLA